MRKHYFKAAQVNLIDKAVLDFLANAFYAWTNFFCSTLKRNSLQSHDVPSATYKLLYFHVNVMVK